MSSRIRLCLTLALSLLTFGSGAALAGRPDVPDGVSNGRWFVQLDGSVESFRANAAANKIPYTERFTYKKVWKGVSVDASSDAITQISKLPGVKAIFPVLTVPRPEEQISPEDVYSLGMIGADIAQNDLGLTGAGVKVAVIDTGIDYDHPDLGGGFGPGHRVATGWDFVGDRYDAAGTGGALVAHPDADPDDCAGHGTHVAGIIGASGDPENGGARGVAPGVTFGAYRVFGCVGSTDSDIMLAAMERALGDGMQVLNMSIGAAFQTWPEYPTAVGADALVDAGMVVVTSIGNSGANGVYSASAPGVGNKVIGVASVDNVRVERPYFTASPDDAKFGYAQATGAPAAPTSGNASLARTGTSTSTADACTALTAGSLTGKVALIRRGTCSFYIKSKNAEAAGAIGVIIYNNVAGLQNITVAPPTATDPAVGIPVVSVSNVDGGILDGRIAAGPTDITWTDQTDVFPYSNGGLVSPFSSFGLTAELGLKPEISAPGGFIRSTWPLEAGGYATISGTSMASPHVAGAAALYLEAHPGATQDTIRAAFQNTADPYVWSGNPGLGFLEYVHHQGAGTLDVDDAVLATTAVTPSELSLGEGTNANPKAVTLAVTNNGTAPVTYNLSHQAALASGGTFTVGTFTTAAGVTFASSSVSVPAGSTATVDVTITPPSAAAAGRVYGGYLVLTPTSGGARLRVPYAGFAGDYQAIQVLAAGGCASVPFPAVFKLGGETVCQAATPTTPAVKLDIAVTPQADGTVYNVEDSKDRPVVLYHRAHQSRHLEIRAVDVATNTSYLVASADYLSRNAANGTSYVNGGFSTYTWDGKAVFTTKNSVQRRELPNGTYKLQLVVTKALAEPGNPAHIETWSSPALVITRR